MSAYIWGPLLPVLSGPITGTGAANLPSLTGSGAGIVGFSGSGAATLPHLTGLGEGAISIWDDRGPFAAAAWAARPADTDPTGDWTQRPADVDPTGDWTSRPADVDPTGDWTKRVP